jgi:hypothetical protein
VHGYESRDVTVSWQEASPGDMRDIWVIYEPNESWYVEDVLNIAVGARSMTGDAVSSSNFSFQVESAEQREMRLSSRAEPLNVPGADPESGESNAEVLEDEPGQFSIHPDTVYAQPRRVWIPVPEQVTADNVRIYYYHPHGADRGWYPAEQVEDWLVPDSTVTVMFDNTRYLGFMVRHAGVIQLGIDE